MDTAWRPLGWRRAGGCWRQQGWAVPGLQGGVGATHDHHACALCRRVVVGQRVEGRRQSTGLADRQQGGTHALIRLGGLVELALGRGLRHWIDE